MTNIRVVVLGLLGVALAVGPQAFAQAAKAENVTVMKQPEATKLAIGKTYLRVADHQLGTMADAKHPLNGLDGSILTPGAPLAQEREPIIDMHLHADLPPHDVTEGAPALCRPYPCRGEGRATASHADTLEKTLEAMRRYNIVKGFVSGIDLELVRKWTAAAPGRFIAAPFILEAGDPDPGALRKEYAAGRLAGMGEIATQLTGLPPNDAALDPYFVLAEEFDVPVLIHTAGIGPYMPGFRSAAGNPLLLEEVLARHPKLRLYLENAGFPYLREMVAMMYQYPQLHADVSTITWVIPRAAFHGYLKALVEAGLGKRLMFGSDQMRWPGTIGRAIEAIEAADFLTAEQKRDILHDNAARFLRLEEMATQ